MNDMNDVLVIALVQRYGWNIEETGGGCQALQRPRPEGGYWWITEEGGASIPETVEEPVALGSYDADGQQVGELCRYDGLEAAMIEVLITESKLLAPDFAQAVKAELAKPDELHRCYGCERVLRASEGTWSRTGEYVLCGYRCPGSSPRADPLIFDALQQFVERETPSF